MLRAVLFLTVYLALLISYFFSETSGCFKRRAVNKTALSAMFLFCGLRAYFRCGDLMSIHALFAFALFFCALGDVLLLRSLVRGGICFSVGNILFFVYELILAFDLGLRFRELWIALPILLLFWGGLNAAAALGHISFAEMKAFPIYLFPVSLHGSLGLALAYSHPTEQFLLLGIGLFLFMISDYFLAIRQFKYKTDLVLRMNSGSYFIGLLLTSLSLTRLPG